MKPIPSPIMSIVLPRLGLFLVADDLTELARGLKYCEQVRVLVNGKPYSLFPIETSWERLYIHQKQQRNAEMGRCEYFDTPFTEHGGCRNDLFLGSSSLTFFHLDKRRPV